MFPFLFLVYFTCFVDKEDFDIPQVTILYITEYNALNYNQAVTHVKRCIKTVDDYAKIFRGEYEKPEQSMLQILNVGLLKESLVLQVFFY